MEMEERAGKSSDPFVACLLGVCRGSVVNCLPRPTCLPWVGIHEGGRLVVHSEFASCQSLPRKQHQRRSWWWDNATSVLPTLYANAHECTRGGPPPINDSVMTSSSGGDLWKGPRMTHFHTHE